MNTSVIIPALNESEAIGMVISDIPNGVVSEIIVVDNNSTDNTVENAKNAGATVLSEPNKGYGYSCLRGIDYLNNKSNGQRPDVVVFLDGDFSDYPEEINQLLQPIRDSDYDMVIGSRALGDYEKGSMQPQQIFGNWLAVQLIRIFYKVKFTDLGPFRAIKFDKLLALDMKDKTFGWTVEMQLKAAKEGLRCCEVPVKYRKRVGVSKITGTLKGTIMAGYKIIWTIFRYL